MVWERKISESAMMTKCLDARRVREAVVVWERQLWCGSGSCGVGVEGASGSCGVGAEGANGSCGVGVEGANGSCGVGAEGASGSCGVGVEGASDGGGGDVASASKSFTHTPICIGYPPQCHLHPHPLHTHLHARLHGLKYQRIMLLIILSCHLKKRIYTFCWCCRGTPISPVQHHH